MNNIKDRLIELFSQILGYNDYALSQSDISLEEELKLWVNIEKSLKQVNDNIFKLTELEELFKYVNLTDEERIYVFECLRVLNAYKENTMVTMSPEAQNELKNNEKFQSAIEKLSEIYDLKLKDINEDLKSFESFKRLYNIVEYLENLKDDEYIDCIDYINQCLYDLDLSFELKIEISKLIAEYNILVGNNIKKIYDEEIDKLKDEIKDTRLLNSQTKQELEQLFAKYGYDINLLSPEMLRKMILRGNLSDMEDVFKFYKKINLTLKLDFPAHEKYLYVLYKSNHKVLDELLLFSEKYNINIKVLLSKTSSIFIPKRSNSGHTPINIEGGNNLVGANEDFIENVKLLNDLGYDIKESYEKCPSIFVYSNDILKQNVEALKTYGLDIKNMNDKIQLSGLKNPRLLFTIDQFIELDELSYLFNNTSRLQWAPNEVMFYRLYNAKQYNKANPNNQIKYKNVDREGNTKSFKSSISQYSDDSTGIMLNNKLSATNTINPNIINNVDYTDIILERLEYFEENSIQLDDDGIQLIEELDAIYKQDDLRYNINGKIYSRFKFLRLFKALRNAELDLSFDEILLISMTYNSILNNEEYLDTKKALESLRRGRN